ncbi:FecR family protein [Pedobacter nutrimenti]|uniref:FecR family protein n=1 Tax=Pedobacter nutrimenti TaxID=1241337 RepID=UPI00292D21B6|nr:FecR domain-containing protein [Pedobacter nutrimenti]
MDDLKALYAKYLRRQCTPEEVQKLMGHFQLYGEQSPLAELIERELEEEEPKEEDPADVKALLEENFVYINRYINKKKSYSWYWQLTIAASVLLVCAAGLYFYKRPEQNIGQRAEVASVTDVKPGGDRAKLTLSNGKTIDLDEAANGILAQQSGISITKTTSGQLIYRVKTADLSSKMSYNVISTPKGGQYQIILPDGSKVWLNSASALKFPTAFKDKERRVELHGEGYFEVAKNQNKPFIVQAPGTTVRVLGTHFNVMAYEDEKEVRTTLLEGAVQLKSKTASVILKPGQQGLLLGNIGSIQVQDADLESVMAWRNGYFIFDRANLPELMRQISRWYNLEIVYEGPIGEHEFVGKIKRSSSLNTVLKVLENGGLNFKLEGKTLIVRP